MNSDFPRILALLRKEKGMSQKNAAKELQVSQALLSHYEKGIRECGLGFLVRCADFYGVSCDYLLGRTPDRQGSTLTVEDIPEPEVAGKENRSMGSILPVLNKKLLANSLNIIFDLLSKTKNKDLINEISAFLMISLYRAFRIVHSVNPKNHEGMFGVPAAVADKYADSAMQICQANADSIAKDKPVPGMKAVENPEEISITTEGISQEYPMFASSLLNLIKNSESRIGFKQIAKGK